MNDILDPKNLPAHLAGKKSELSARLEKTLRGGNRLSIRGKQWRLSFGGDEIPSNDNHLDVVIVNAPEKAGRVYYPTSYKGRARILVRYVGQITATLLILHCHAHKLPPAWSARKT